MLTARSLPLQRAQAAAEAASYRTPNTSPQRSSRSDDSILGKKSKKTTPPGQASVRAKQRHRPSDAPRGAATCLLRCFRASSALRRLATRGRAKAAQHAAQSREP